MLYTRLRAWLAMCTSSVIEKNAKLGQYGLCGGNVTYFLNSEAKSIYQKWLKRETRNLAYMLTTRALSEKCSITEMEVVWGHLNESCTTYVEK